MVNRRQRRPRALAAALTFPGSRFFSLAMANFSGVPLAAARFGFPEIIRRAREPARGGRP